MPSTFNFVDAIERKETVSIAVKHDTACGCVPPIVQDGDFDDKDDQEDTKEVTHPASIFSDSEAEEEEFCDDDDDDDDDDETFDMDQLRTTLPDLKSNGDDLVDTDEEEEFDDNDDDDDDSAGSAATAESEIGGYRPSNRRPNAIKSSQSINLIDTDEEDDATADGNTDFHSDSDSDESASTNGFESPSDSEESIPEAEQIKTAQKKQQASSAFRKNRESLTKATFREFNQNAFGGILGSVEVVWNSKLKTTAGLTRLSKCRTNTTPGIPPKHIATIELSTKVVDCKERLRTTLLHEMVHAAVWIADKKSKPPHGEDFKRWARTAMRKILDVKVTTTHSYEIDFKYIWRCSTQGCSSKVQRHSKSFDTTKYRCSKCKGTFVPAHNTAGRKQAQPSAYNLFVKEQSKLVRQQLLDAQKARGIADPKVSQADVMKTCAQRWKEQKANNVKN
jgi:predicted SprT family Zn-dependent metalloprotease